MNTATVTYKQQATQKRGVQARVLKARTEKTQIEILTGPRKGKILIVKNNTLS